MLRLITAALKVSPNKAVQVGLIRHFLHFGKPTPAQLREYLPMIRDAGGYLPRPHEVASFMAALHGLDKPDIVQITDIVLEAWYGLQDMIAEASEAARRGYFLQEHAPYPSTTWNHIDKLIEHQHDVQRECETRSTRLVRFLLALERGDIPRAAHTVWRTPEEELFDWPNLEAWALTF